MLSRQDSGPLVGDDDDDELVADVVVGDDPAGDDPAGAGEDPSDGAEEPEPADAEGDGEEGDSTLAIHFAVQTCPRGKASPSLFFM